MKNVPLINVKLLFLIDSIKSVYYRIQNFYILKNDGVYVLVEKTSIDFY